MKVLISGGGTREPIDDVRFIGNSSTGQTASRLADFFSTCGNEVVLLLAQDAVGPTEKVKIKRFRTFSDLDRLFRDQLQEAPAELILHLAAVSDFYVDSVPGKIKSGGELTLHLKPHFKIIEKLKSYALPERPLLVGFKLTSTSLQSEREQAVAKLFASSDVDLVVHNDQLERDKGKVEYKIYSRGGIVAECTSVSGLGEILEQWEKEKNGKNQQR